VGFFWGSQGIFGGPFEVSQFRQFISGLLILICSDNYEIKRKWLMRLLQGVEKCQVTVTQAHCIKSHN